MGVGENRDGKRAAGHSTIGEVIVQRSCYMRKQGDSFEKEMMRGTLPESHARGRPFTAWMDNIGAWTISLTTDELLRKGEERDKWRSFARRAANPRSEDTAEGKANN